MKRHRRFKYVYSPCFLSRRVDWFTHRLMPLVMVQVAVILVRLSPYSYGLGARFAFHYGLFLQRHSPRWGVLSEHWQSRVDLAVIAAQKLGVDRSWVLRVMAGVQRQMIANAQHEMIVENAP